jgi:hypothetical protein
MKALALLLCPLMLSACVATAIGVTGAVVGTAVKTTGAVAGAAVSVVTPHHRDKDPRGAAPQ